MAYIVDTNCFIQPFLHYYGFEVCPGYWQWIDQQHAANIVCSIEKIKDELTDKGDDLSIWADGYDPAFFLPIDSATMAEFANVMNWVNKQNFTSPAKREFARGADPFLIAYAIAHKHTIITLETYEPLRRNKVKIPNVCMNFGVPWMVLHDFLKLNKVTFKLS